MHRRHLLTQLTRQAAAIALGSLFGPPGRQIARAAGILKGSAVAEAVLRLLGS